ncbi:MAG: hypothetical protein Q8M57_06595 [Nitrosomonas sp.]|uniref:hypothetical protein n=1 Tax=Nitrosomonas sp. TaxID=42353 RepID=UPI00273041DC|nr:hypothetical protein [Nitrosomonas sp.]MDP2224659.1 hypothetical protein [Nitrosomonas sp.]MDP3280701.1 hypothetical protein [Nitrosomonas sp.]
MFTRSSNIARTTPHRNQSRRTHDPLRPTQIRIMQASQLQKKLADVVVEQAITS